MPDARIVFDHVHLISREPQAAASWYVQKLGGTIVSSRETPGAEQVVVALPGANVMVRGQRPGEDAAVKDRLQWGTDHFAFRVDGDFDGFCDELKKKGVRFTVEPEDINPSVRIAFIEAPDGVSIELLHRRK
jgi:lactoylglutathione lyase